MKQVVERPSTEVQHRPGRKDTKGGVDPSTVLKIQQAAKMISEGKSRATIVDWIQERYGLSRQMSEYYYQSAVRFLLPKDENEYRKGLIQANIERLEKIIEETMKDRNYRVAREAIAELNKVAGVGKEGIAVAVKNDPDNNTQEFIIKIGE